MTRHTRFSSVPIYVGAVAASSAAFMLTLVLILEFEYPNLERAGGANFHPVVVAIVFSAVLGGIFAALRPSRWLLFAVLSSSIFWGFFSIVFVCYLVGGEVDWVPLGQALLTLSSAICAATVSAWLSRSIRRRARTEL